jgi:predicted NBD/HSP70 family sugar kinase
VDACTIGTVFAGIDLGGTQVRVALADSDGQIVATERARTAELGGPRGVPAWIGAAVARLAATDTIQAAAIGAPGPWMTREAFW